MRQSHLFTKTLKQAPADEVSLNSRLLARAGFIDKTMAGVYTFLPLGWRVLTKIERIIREEMDALGAQEMLMPGFSSSLNWEATGRLEKVDVLFEARGANKISREKNSSVCILNPTHEEIITPIIQKYASSYKDLPVAVYQIQTKYRNEPRPKAGLLRGREFRMKDLYSFHEDQEALYEFYEKVKKAYNKIFERMGVGEDTYITLASGGDFTHDYSHEFQTRCGNGEDAIFRDPETGVCYNREVAPSRVPDTEGEKEGWQPLEKVETKNVKTMEGLTEFMDIPANKTVKTLLYEIEGEEIIAVALRGDYDLNEEKLFRAVGFKGVKLAEEDKIKELTGAEQGYAGLIGLSEKVKVYMDDSVKGMSNFVTGANETDYHYKNVNLGRDVKEPDEFYDIKEAQPGDISPESGKVFEVFKASEVGNIFPLNTRFSESFGYYYDTPDGDKKLVYMGCYGIGPTRIMGVLAERFSDDAGLAWPETIAPFRVHLLQLPSENEKVAEEAREVYHKMRDNNIEVLYDDREGVQAGEKFTDADLIGCPYRVVVSGKTIKEGKVEVKKRGEKEVEMLDVGELMVKLLNG